MTEKSKTNKKWTSNKKYRTNYEATFKKPTITYEQLWEKWKFMEQAQANNPDNAAVRKAVVFARNALEYYEENLKKGKRQ